MGSTLPGHCPRTHGEFYDSQAPLTEGLGARRSLLAKAAPNNPVERTAHSIGFLGYSWRFPCGPPLTGSVGRRDADLIRSSDRRNRVWAARISVRHGRSKLH